MGSPLSEGLCKERVTLDLRLAAVAPYIVCVKTRTYAGARYMNNAHRYEFRLCELLINLPVIEVLDRIFIRS
jgi:hypothetical protein